MNKNSVKNLGEYAKKGGPGRKKTGRSLAIQILDEMLAKESNQTKFRIALQDDFDKDTINFFKTIVMPLLPRNVELTGHDGGTMELSLGSFASEWLAANTNSVVDEKADDII